MKTYLLLSLAATLLAAGCKKDNTDPDGLVPATQTGENTGDFLLNGQPFNPRKNPTSTGSPVGASWYGRKVGMQLSFHRYNSSTDDKGLNFFFPVTTPGVVVLNTNSNPNVVPSSGIRYGIYTSYHPSPRVCGQ